MLDGACSVDLYTRRSHLLYRRSNYSEDWHDFVPVTPTSTLSGPPPSAPGLFAFDVKSALVVHLQGVDTLDVHETKHKLLE